jgi:hypothetical protein
LIVAARNNSAQTTQRKEPTLAPARGRAAFTAGAFVMA